MTRKCLVDQVRHDVLGMGDGRRAVTTEIDEVKLAAALLFDCSTTRFAYAYYPTRQHSEQSVATIR
ncbi:hypothetical protein MSZK_44540 [Mycobacterium sp. shizuoka-1]|nr:hypothetical protein MSZK_44540 [Mycobacterium sp. shizuoka-1]